jgi:hypothetical protein
MSTLQQRIAIMANLIAQLRELNQLRERVRKAQLTAQDMHDKRDENLTVAIETYLATFEGHTPEQAKAKAMERLDHVRKAAVKDRRNAFHIVRDPPPDKQ